MDRTFLRSESSTSKGFVAALAPPPRAVAVAMLVHGPLRADCFADLEQSNGHPKKRYIKQLSIWTKV